MFNNKPMAKKQRDDLKILLITSRKDKKMRDQEVKCILKYSGLKDEQINPHNIYEEGVDVNSIKDFDAVIFGGTGDFGVHEMQEKYPEAYEQIKQASVYCLENNVPTLSICMQFPTVIFGGKVARDPEKKELGTATIKLTEKATTDPLLKNAPKEFKSKVGHNDSTIDLPHGAEVLAESDKCIHIYKLGNKFYFSQSHFELGVQEFRERLEHYREDYASDMEEYNRLMAEDDDVSDCTALLKSFVDNVVL